MTDDYKKFGRFVSILLYLVQGIYVTFFPMIIGNGTEELRMRTALFVIVSLIVFYFISRVKEDDYLVLEIFYYISSSILSMVCIASLNTPYTTLFLFFLQWLSAVIFLERRLCTFLFLCHSLLFVLMHLPTSLTGKGFFSLPEIAGLILFDLVTLVVTISICNFIQGQILKNEATERSFENMMTLADAMCNDTKDALQSKSNFLSNMSHEMRTPINTMLGMNELIMRETKDKNIANYAVNIDSSARMLLALINDVLDFSKLESGIVNIDSYPYRLSSLLSDVVNMVEQRALAKGVKFKVDVLSYAPEYLIGDEMKLKQIALNLLSNAIKYTDAGEITFKVYSEKDGEDGAILFFEVSDTGRGIKEEDMDKLFKAFTRLEHSKNRNIEGTGLGLSIIYNFVKLMGGDISVTSRYGEGSTFVAKIPQKIENYLPIGDFEKRYSDICGLREEYAPLFNAENAKVLIVDDNPINLNVTELLLKETGMNISKAINGNEAICKCKDERFDIILLDYMMPEMDGIETLRVLKEEKLIDDTIVVALTADAVNGAKEKYLKEGFDDYLSKPIIGRELEKIFIKWLPENLVVKVDSPNQADEIKDHYIANLPVIKGIDWNVAAQYFTNKSKLDKVLNDIVTFGPKEIENMHTAYETFLETGDCDQFRLLIHATKSITGLIGAVSMSDRAKDLETASKTKDTEYIEKNVDSFLDDYSDLIKEIVSTIDASLTLEKPLVDKESLKANILQAVVALKEFDSDKADDLIKDIKNYKDSLDLTVFNKEKAGTELKNLINSFIEAAYTLDVDNADNTAKAIISLLDESTQMID